MHAYKKIMKINLNLDKIFRNFPKPSNAEVENDDFS